MTVPEASRATMLSSPPRRPWPPADPQMPANDPISVPVISGARSPSPLLTTVQAAEYLQVSVRMVKNLMGDGRIAYIKIGRATRVHIGDLDDYVAPNRRKQRIRRRVC